MQEDLENRTVTLMVSSSKFTGRTMKSAILHFLSYSKHKVQEHKNVVPHGKQSVKQLTGQHEGVMNLPVGDDVDMRKEVFKEFLHIISPPGNRCTAEKERDGAGSSRDGGSRIKGRMRKECGRDY